MKRYLIDIMLILLVVAILMDLQTPKKDLNQQINDFEYKIAHKQVIASNQNENKDNQASRLAKNCSEWIESCFKNSYNLFKDFMSDDY